MGRAWVSAAFAGWMLVLASGCAERSRSGMVPYRNEELGFELERPDGWMVVDRRVNHRKLESFQAPGGQVVCAFVKDPSFTLPPLVSIAVPDEQPPGQMPSLAEWLAHLNAVLPSERKSDSNRILLNPAVIVEIQGRRAITYTEQIKQAQVGQSVVAETYIFIRGRNTLVISAVAFSKDQQRYAPVFRALIESFKFISKGMPEVSGRLTVG